VLQRIRGSAEDEDFSIVNKNIGLASKFQYKPKKVLEPVLYFFNLQFAQNQNYQKSHPAKLAANTDLLYAKG
jgi:hypothetical protein